MKDAAKAFEAKFGVPVEVHGGGVNLGIRQTLDGKVELGGSCRHLLDDEKAQGAVATIVAYDMLVFMVHPGNPVGSLTLDQVRGIFAGKITNWSEVGGPDQKILIVGREGSRSGVGTMFREKVMQGVEDIPPAVETPSSKETELAMEKTPWGIAVSGISSASLRKVKLLKLHVSDPDRANFVKGTYPLARPLYLVTKGPPQGLTKKFIDFMLSDEGQKIVSRHAFSLAEYCEREKAITGSASCANHAS